MSNLSNSGVPVRTPAATETANEGTQPLRFSEPVRRFLDEPRFAVIATVNPDGTPHQAVIWYRFDPSTDTITINSAEGRRWPSNLHRYPRISMMVEDGYQWVSVRGTVEVIHDQATAQADIAAMARAYVDDPEEAQDLICNRYEKMQRVSFLVRPTKVTADLGEA